MAASANFMVADLRKERDGSRVSIPELTNLIDGGEGMTEKRRKISKCLN